MKKAIITLVIFCSMMLGTMNFIFADETSDDVVATTDTVETTEDTESTSTVETILENVDLDKAYTISNTTKPCKSNYSRCSHYNSKTRNYFTIRSYMEKFEKQGGGTLILKAGTYTISNCIYIPSNVTIILQHGVKLVKGYSTGCKLSASPCMFQFINPSFPKNGKKKKYGYNGVHDINIIGDDVTLDMNAGSRKVLAMVLGHCKNINIAGINFVDMSYKAHFIELNSSKNVNVLNCTFDGNTKSKSGLKEAINIDSTDKKTKGFNNKWSSHDKTCCTNVTIDNCEFRDLRAGIGTHQISYKNKKQCYHVNITVSNCTFENIGNNKSGAYVIRMMNWKNAVIENNTFTDCDSYNTFGAGVVYPEITDNTYIDASKSNPICIKKYATSKYYPKSKSYYSKDDISGNTDDGNLISL